MSAQIIGWAHTRFGKSEAPDTTALMAEVIGPALDHAGIGAEDVDGIFCGVWNNGFQAQDFQAALVGMACPALARVPAVRLENACATGSAALFAALDFIQAGRGRIALVLGAEKMTAIPGARAGDILLAASWMGEEAGPAGFAGVFAQITQDYFRRNGDRSHEMAMIAAKNHSNAMANPLAHLHKDLGVAFCDTVSDLNPLVAAPLRRSDCAPLSDGAAALVIADAETAATMQRAIAFRARIQANDVLALSHRDPIAFDGPRRAWAEALKTAGLTAVTELDLVETHDCFTIAEMIEYEAMGLTPPGRGWTAIREGRVLMGAELPVNPSGGLKARGHPIGATGISMQIMAAQQLMDEAGGMQVPGATLAGVMNMGGAAVASYVSVLERVK
ncbi:acetyl-CoA acetyltransferase [Neotabrizicola sp. VNH66]|uniref:acetyl-CoA acetyltransferase n=1 Tax=Neotabrizicola sp. VNH66 TaxID=3400918 RepID=UPI003C058CD8